MVDLEATLIKHTNFDEFDWNGWPHPHELERFFLAPKGEEWSFAGGNDSWGLRVEGLCGTEQRSRFEQVTSNLSMIGNSDLGVYLSYRKWDGRVRQQRSYVAKGDLSRLGEFVRSLHGTPLSVGLFVPFPVAWKAVKEFIETDGELPTSIEWIASSDLPPETFPDP
ncbi:Imm1 family immunity protein [Nitrobacter sp. 62-13]|jgi:hypothetical protein|uniref:Imm1 family immunity protein n=1 Tax=Nitrobacter sp. 62-13 TaxID=1895797 RepID=UPI000B0BFC2C|nr:Imm1 family immunity protein [Nitrobacter sp. 62-13]